LPQLPWKQKRGVFIKFDLGIFEKCVRQTFDGRKKERRRRIITRYDTVFEIKW
jgi:hypothetical protein